MKEWISVEDELPDYGERVLVVEEIYPEPVIGKYIQYESRQGTVDVWDTEIAEDWSNVTHWQSLPKLPEAS